MVGKQVSVVSYQSQQPGGLVETKSRFLETQLDTSSGTALLTSRQRRTDNEQGVHVNEGEPGFKQKNGRT